MIEITKFLKDNNIPFVTSGKNIGKKAVASLNCPFCGDDTGHHLGILEYENTYMYKCWRNAEHKGSIYKLIATLLHISYQDVKLLLSEKAFVNDDFFLDIDTKLCYNNSMLENKEVIKSDRIHLPYDFVPVSEYGLGKIFQNYLNKREIFYTVGFDIWYAITGDWKYRLIFPLSLDNKWVTWQSRSIIDDVSLRYKDLERSKSVRHTKDCLFNFDSLLGGSCLLVCEGIFDVLKLYQNDNFQKVYGFDATCIFTTSIRDSQIDLLIRKAKLYKKVVILLDKGAELQAMALKEQLSAFIPNVSVFFLDMADDPGSLKKEDISILVKRISEKEGI